MTEATSLDRPSIPTAPRADTIHNDAALLAACRHYHEARAAFNAGLVMEEDTMTRLVAEMEDALAALEDMEPRTFRGLQAKAFAALTAMTAEFKSQPADEWRMQAQTDELVTASVLSQIAKFPPLDHEADTGADAELIAACTKHIANADAYNASDEPDFDDRPKPLLAAYRATGQAISHAKPVTLAGIVAKARAAKHDAGGAPSGREVWDDRWTASIVDDLLRVCGGAA